MKWVAGAFYTILQEAGVKVYEYVPRVLHAKTVLIDDWATVGSSNFNRRSLLRDLEVDIVLSKPESIMSMESQFLLDIAQSNRISRLKWERRPWLLRFTEWVCLRLRNWI